MHEYYMHIFSVTMNHVFQCGKRKALFKLILGFKFQCIAMPPFPKKQVIFHDSSYIIFKRKNGNLNLYIYISFDEKYHNIFNLFDFSK